jgi:hypothetical protein
MLYSIHGGTELPHERDFHERQPEQLKDRADRCNREEVKDHPCSEEQF